MRMSEPLRSFAKPQNAGFAALVRVGRTGPGMGRVWVLCKKCPFYGPWSGWSGWSGYVYTRTHGSEHAPLWGPVDTTRIPPPRAMAAIGDTRPTRTGRTNADKCWVSCIFTDPAHTRPRAVADPAHPAGLTTTTKRNVQ
jgi:hypothetical protein